MKSGASAEDVRRVQERLAKELPHLHLQNIEGQELTIIAAVGDARAVAELGLQSDPSVDRVVPIDQSYKLAARQTRPEGTRFLVGQREWGQGIFRTILGPCTVENHESALRAAQICADAGADAIRAGIFKPRTSPFSFQGPGREGLQTLRAIREATGLPVVSELVAAEDAEVLGEVVDIVQIGARSMQNYHLLREAGRLGKPVLLKRGLSATLDELLQAADYVVGAGEERVILCERGIRTFDQSSRFTLDLGSVPVLQEKTHLPVFVDPSHAAGRRSLVPRLAQAAVAVGADGLIVEATTDPDHARCDADQQLDVGDAEHLLKQWHAIREAIA